MSDVIITRKIQLVVAEENKEKRIAHYKTLREWGYIVDKGANLISTHRYMQAGITNMIYLSEGIKAKIADSAKDADGILNTSNQNSTYRVLSSLYKGDIPSDILTCLNQKVTQAFNTYKKDIMQGKRALMSYKANQPIPFSAVSVRNIKQGVGDKDKNDYYFDLFDIPLKTFFGRDASENGIIFSRMLAGEYKMNSSSIQFVDNKLFLRLTVSFPKNQTELVEGRLCEAYLDFETPIIASIAGISRDRTNKIGNKDEFLYQRLAIQQGMHRLQKNLKYVKGGKGRNKKLQKLEMFHEKEHNYVDEKLHLYSALLVKYALENKCQKIVLKNYEVVKDEAHEKIEFLLRNWNYYGLAEKIKYKANKYGIEVEVPKEEKTKATAPEEVVEPVK